MRRTHALILIVASMIWGVAVVATAQDADHGHNHVHDPQQNFLTAATRDALSNLTVQDYQGRMKPMDTLARESAMKVGKRSRLDGWEPVDMFVSWMAQAGYWFEQPIVAVRHPDLKRLIGVSDATKHVTLSSLLDESGRYRLIGDIEHAHQTRDRDRSTAQRKLISFDERVNVFNMGLRGLSFRVFPVPGDDNNRWFSPGEFGEEVAQSVPADVMQEYRDVFADFYHGLQELDNNAIQQGAARIADLQLRYGNDVIPTPARRAAELTLNRLMPFTWVTIPYLFAFAVLMAAYAWSLVRRNGRQFRVRHPLYALGMILYIGSVVYHTYGYVLRWRAAGHAPLSNGYESLIFIGLAIAVVGVYYELRARRGSVGALSAMLSAFILGVAMLPTFDPAISPLVPVLSSFWLIVHVTVITASYGFLALAAVMSLTMLVLHLFKGPGRKPIRDAIIDLHTLHWNVLVAGLAFLAVGTFLGGVWANESWGRYWGWDPKETWALVTILVYGFVVHMRYVESLNRPVTIAAGSLLSILSVAMTYFGVNYFLSGLHSYAQGSAPSVPGWVYVATVMMVLLVIAALAVDRSRTWATPQRAVKTRPRRKKRATAA